MSRILTGGLFLILLASCGGNFYRPGAFKGNVASKTGMLVGEINRDSLLAPPHDKWFKGYYSRYSPDYEAMATIKNSLNEVDSIRAFIGTWCIDSRIEIPRLFKILDENNYNSDKVKITALEFSKTLPDKLQNTYGVTMIPTIIFYKDGKELNRFVEYPRETFDQDIAKIVSGAEYRHSYLK